MIHISKKTLKSKLQQIFLILLLFNVLLVIFRNEGFKYYPYKTYPEVFVPSESLFLKDLFFNNDSVYLYMSQSNHSKNTKFILLIDDTLTSVANYKSNIISFKLNKNYHNYTIKKQGILFRDYHVKIDHALQNNKTVNEFLYSSLPGPKIRTQSIKTWYNPTLTFTKEQLQKGKQLLQQYTRVYHQTTDTQKIKEIIYFTRLFKKNASGIHAFDLAKLTALEQIKKALQEPVDLACGNYTAIYNFLLSCADVPNRVVQYNGPSGNWQYGIHYFNSVYIREVQQWTIIDGSNNIFLPYDTVNQNFINTDDIRNLIKYNVINDIIAWSFVQNSLQKIAYSSVAAPHYYYNASNANIAFLHANSKEYFLQPLVEWVSFYRTMDYYSINNNNDWFKINIKITAIILFFIVLILNIIFFFINKNPKKL